jgi:hypothetical protein
MKMEFPMNPSPKAHGILPLTHLKTARTVWFKFLALISKPDFIAVVAFCAIGLLTTLNLILRFPDFGAVIEQYNQF